VLNPKVFEYLDKNCEDVMWEESPLENLAKDGELVAYKHKGFWKCMDALRDKLELEKLWNDNHAQWKIW
jgi:glucose-1-phosphate cytidylyltransferase